MHRQKDRRPPHEQSGWETLGRIAWHSAEIGLVLVTHGGLKWLAKKADLEGELWVTPLVDGAAWLAVIWFLRNVDRFRGRPKSATPTASRESSEATL